MKQVWISKVGSPDVLAVQQVPDPTPRTGEVRIRVEAAGVNDADVLGRLGRLPDAPPMPYVPGFEVAGVVDIVGQGVPDLKEGDKVLALTRLRGYSDVLCVPHKQVFKRLEWMSAEDGAAIPMNYLSAFQMLVIMGSLRRGNKVLIHQADAGIGLAALDICRIIGAETYGTALADRHDFLLERGLHHAIDDRNYDYERVIMDLTAGRGVQLILEPLGSGHWRKNYRLLMPTGRLIHYGAFNLAPARRRSPPDWLRLAIDLPLYTPPKLVRDNKGIIGVHLSHLWDNMDLVREWAKQVISWYDEALFRPHLDRTFRFANAAEAHRHVEARKNLGKVLLIP